MRPWFAAVVLLLLLSTGCRAPARVPFEPTHETQLGVLGGISRDGQEGTDERASWGLDLVISEPRAPSWHYEVGWRMGDDHGPNRGIDRTLDYEELFFGVRQAYLPDRRLQPYVGFGGTYRVLVRDLEVPVFSGVDGGLNSDDSRALGWYARTGVQWVPPENHLGARRGVVVGLDLRRAESGGSYDSTELALVLGYRW
jgi:hypothetical protein